jgi:thioredoxin 1
MLTLIFYALVGGGIGTTLGYYGKCSSGTCPLTSTWWRGAIYGAVLGGLFYFISGGSTPATMNISTANVKRIGESQFDAEITQSASPVVVDFYATWCGPCKILSPILDEMAGTLTNKIKFVKINIDEAPQLAQRLAIQGVPTLVFFKNGKAVDSLVGLPQTDILKTHLDSLVEPDRPAKNSG